MVSLSQVSVSNTKDAWDESMSDESAIPLATTLLALVYKKENFLSVRQCNFTGKLVDEPEPKETKEEHHLSLRRETRTAWPSFVFHS